MISCIVPPFPRIIRHKSFGIMVRSTVISSLFLVGILGQLNNSNSNGVAAFLSSSSNFKKMPNNNQGGGGGGGTSKPSSLFASAADAGRGPVLVVGATGKVGRRVVSQLLSPSSSTKTTPPRPVRALVRNTTKANELFDFQSTSYGSTSTASPSDLELIHCDLSIYDDPQTVEILNKAIQGCDAIISVSGTFRFSKLSDFLPWRLFQHDASKWCTDRTHPYYVNYMAQKLLVELAEKHNVKRMVRLTGLSVGFSPFNPVSALFSGLLSMTSRYHFLAEECFRNSKVQSIILRPGGLAEEERDVETTSLQIDPSGNLPPPGRVGRTDVAALAVAAVDPYVLTSSKSYTLGVRWVGEGVKPRPQGTKEEGCKDAAECMKKLSEETTASTTDVCDATAEHSKKMKPYGVAVAVYFYTVLALSIKGLVVLGTKIVSMIT